MKPIHIIFLILIIFINGTSIYSQELNQSDSTVTDIDGNVYPIVQIGNQIWMAENLKVTHYRNGDAIPNITGNSQWSNLSTGAYCAYNNNEANVETYGYLYNWFTVSDNRNIAPEGWHVPTNAEWDILMNYLGGYEYAGGKMKEAGTVHWHPPNTGATNESGFNGLPGGKRISGIFYTLGDDGIWLTSTEAEETGPNAYVKYLQNHHGSLSTNTYGIKNGYSIRCVKDVGETSLNDDFESNSLREFSLYQNYPNPFNPSTVISYQLSINSKVILAIYNILGQKVTTLVNGWQNAGEHQVLWQADGLPSGIYLMQLQAEGQMERMKLVLQK